MRIVIVLKKNLLATTFKNKSMHKLFVYKELPLFVVCEAEPPPFTDHILILFFPPVDRVSPHCEGYAYGQIPSEFNF